MNILTVRPTPTKNNFYLNREYIKRLEITGRLPGATADSTYVYLSNIDEIPFQKATMASGLSSNTNDYFSPDEAVLVELS